MDYLNKLLKWIDYNRWKVAALILTVLIVGGCYGLTSKTASLLDPKMKVTRAAFESEAIKVMGDFEKRKIQLQAEADKLNAEIQATNETIQKGKSDLQRQDELRVELFNIGGAVLQQFTAGTVSASSLIGTLLTVGALFVGGGSYLDKKRTDAVLEEKKTEIAKLTVENANKTG